MSDERIDLSPLDPTSDREQFDRVVHRVAEAAAPVLARRRATNSAMGQIARWRVPTMAAAAAVVLIALTVISRNDTESTDFTTPPAVQWAQALGMPSTFAAWVNGGETPTTAEVLSAFGEEMQ